MKGKEEALVGVEAEAMKAERLVEADLKLKANILDRRVDSRKGWSKGCSSQWAQIGEAEDERLMISQDSRIR